MGQSFFCRWSPLFYAPLWFLCLTGLLPLFTVPPSCRHFLGNTTPSLHQPHIFVAAEAMHPGSSSNPFLWSSWLSGSVAPVNASAKLDSVSLETDESIGEGVLFFVLPDGTIDSCEDINSTSLIEYLLTGYSELHSGFVSPNLIARNESVADLSIPRRRVVTSPRNLQSPLEPEIPSIIEHNEGGFLRKDGTDKTITAANALSILFGANAPPPSISQKTQLDDAASASAPIRSLAKAGSQHSGLPLISSYHYMTPQRARTGWAAAVAPYGLDGTRSGSSVPLVSALHGTVLELPPSVAYSAAAAPEKLNQEGPRLSGLQVADRQYTAQAEEIGEPSRSLQGVLGSLLEDSAPLIGNLAAGLTTALNGMISPNNRPVDSSSRLADIFPHTVTANAKQEHVVSPSAAIGDMAASVGLMGRALLPALIEMAEPLVSEVGSLLLQQAVPIGSRIVQSIVRETNQAISSGDPAMGRVVESMMRMAEDFLRPMLESTIQGQFRSLYSPRFRAQLVDDIDEVMRSNFGTLAQSISGNLSKELPPQLQESMAATVSTVVRQSLGEVLDDAMPRHVRNLSRDTASRIQQEVRALLSDPSSLVSAETTQALPKEISRSTTLSMRNLLQNLKDNIPEIFVGDSEQPERGLTDSDVSRSRAMRGREIREAAAGEGTRRRRQFEDEELRRRQFEDEHDRRRQPVGGEVGAKLSRDRQTASGHVDPLLSDVAKNINIWLTHPGGERQDTVPVISETPSWDRLRELYRNTSNRALMQFSVEQQRNEFGQTRQDRNTSADQLSAYEEAMVDAHNTYRKDAGIRTVQWDRTLATFIVNYMESQDEYKNCKMEHSKQSQRDRVGDFTNIGENLYTSWGGTIFPTAERIVEAWYNEIHCYRYGPVGAPCTKNPNPQCARIAGFKGSNPLTGHFTQLMWSSVTHIGCGAIECSSYKGPGKKFFGGCSYGSKISGYGGNMVGEYPFDSRTAIRLGLPVGTCN
eukprot:GHVS01082169.1.p1 GENE.GHVS01082169.1~~GHVS01082169.1.p1  ORF type:complete len:981 (+),score=73.35 GHVS01082169.1:191-3133(+)